MKVTSETVATREVVLTVEPDAQDVEKAMRDVARAFSRYRPVPGFRPGKAPYTFVERMFGREAILQEAVNQMAPELYRQAVAEAKVEPYEQSAFEIVTQAPLTLKVNVPLSPVVTLGNYATLHVDPEPEVAITDAQVDEEVERVRRRHATHEPVQRAAQMGDQVVATVIGKIGEEVVTDQKNTTFSLREEMQPAGFSEGLVGLAADESRQYTLNYPQDYIDSNVAGKEVAISATMHTVRETKLPELNDDLAKMAGDHETLADLRQSLAADLQKRLEEQARTKESNAALEALVGISAAEYPAAALKREMDSAIARQRSRLQGLGFSYENYLQMTGSTEEQQREQLRPAAEQSLLRGLVLNEFATAEKLTVAPEELEAALQEVADMYGDRAPQMLEQIHRSGYWMSIYAERLNAKALSRLTGLLTGREQPRVEEPAAAEAATPAADEPAAVAEPPVPTADEPAPATDADKPADA